MTKYRAVAFLLYNSAYNLQDLKFQNVKRSWLTPSSRTQVLGYVKTTVIVWTTWLLTNDEKSHLRDWIDGCPRLIAQHATWHGLVWIQCLLDVSVQNQHHHEKSLSNPNSHYLCIITRHVYLKLILWHSRTWGLNSRGDFSLMVILDQNKTRARITLRIIF